MKKLVSLLFLAALALSVSAQERSQNGVSWSKYFFTGSMAIGKNLASTVNPKSYAPDNTVLQVGRDTATQAMAIPGVLHTDSVKTPYPRMIVYSYAQGFMGYTPYGWINLTGGSGGSGPIDTTKIATRWWVSSNFGTRGHTAFNLVVGAAGNTITHPALANMTLSTISYAGRSFNSVSFTKPYAGTTLTLSTAGASFYAGQVITITPDSLPAGGGTGGAGTGGSNITALSITNDSTLSVQLSDDSTQEVRIVSWNAWAGYNNALDVLNGNVEALLNRVADMQRNASDPSLAPVASNALHNWVVEDQFTAYAYADTFRVSIIVDLGAQAAVDPFGVTFWMDENAARKVRLKRAGPTGNNVIYTGTNFPDNIRPIIRIIPKS